MKIYASKKKNNNKTKKTIKASSARRRNQKIMAGPGAGYTISYELESINRVNSITVTNVTPSSWYGEGYFDIEADCDVDITVTIDSAQSYGYGTNAPIENLSGKITRINIEGVRDITNLYDESDDDYANIEQEMIDALYNLNEMDALTVLEDDAWENIRSGELVYGGGYTHSTYDGTIALIEDENAMDAEITDKDAILYIDRVVSGDCDSSEYQLSVDGDIIESYFDLDEAIDEANNLITRGVYDSIDIYRVDEFENFNGDIDIVNEDYEETISAE